MNDFQTWVQQELERAIGEETREYLLTAATAWVAGDGVSTDENLHRIEDLGWLNRLSDAVGRDRARVIRCEVAATHLDELAAHARLAVPAGVVDAWRTAMLVAVTMGEPSAASSGDGFDPAEAVREGLLWLYKVRYDRDMFDQSGMPESYWCGRD